MKEWRKQVRNDRPRNKKVANAKGRGRGLQQKVAKDFAAITGYDYGADEMIASREMSQAGTDIRLIGPAKRELNVAVECKAHKTWGVHAWIRQAMANLEGMADWVLIARRMGERRPTVLMAIEYFKKLNPTYQLPPVRLLKSWPILKWIDEERPASTKEYVWTIAAQRPDAGVIIILEYKWYIELLEILVKKRNMSHRKCLNKR